MIINDFVFNDGRIYLDNNVVYFVSGNLNDALQGLASLIGLQGKLFNLTIHTDEKDNSLRFEKVNKDKTYAYYEYYLPTLNGEADTRYFLELTDKAVEVLLNGKLPERFYFHLSQLQ